VFRPLGGPHHVRSPEIGAQLDRDCETVLRGMLDRGLVEKVDTGSPAVNPYRVTAKAIAATGHDSLTSLQRSPRMPVPPLRPPSLAREPRARDAGLIPTVVA
jgi:hypothetical protein